MDKDKITLDYSFGMSPKDPEEIIMSVKGTGIDMTNPHHCKFMEALLNVIGAQMYACANNIDFRNVTTTNKLPIKDSN